MSVIIYQPSKTAMQSGTAKTQVWVLEHSKTAPRTIDPLMGYTSSTDMNQQVRLTFDSKDAAIAYARANGLAYQVREPKKRKPIKKAYADNFKFGRQVPWTH